MGPLGPQSVYLSTLLSAAAFACSPVSHLAGWQTIIMVTSSSRNKKGQHASEKEDISQTQHSAAATPRQPEGAASSGRKRRSTVGGGPMEQEVRRLALLDMIRGDIGILSLHH